MNLVDYQQLLINRHYRKSFNIENELWRTIPVPPTPYFPIPGVLTIVNGKVLLSYGFDPSGDLPTEGGLCSYTLPGVDFHAEDED